MIGSPVSVDSLIWRRSLPINVRRPGPLLLFQVRLYRRRQPLFRGIWQIFPSRITFTKISSLTVFKTLNALFALTSKKPTQDANMIAKNMPIGSRKAVKPLASGPQQCTPAIIMDKNHATNRILIIGSLNFSRNWLHREAFSGGVRIFSP